MKFIFWWDDVFLELFEKKIAHGFQKLTGINNFRLASLFFIIYLVTPLFNRDDSGVSIGVKFAALALSAIPILLILFFAERNHEQHPDFANNFKSDEIKPLRVVFTLFQFVLIMFQRTKMDMIFLAVGAVCYFAGLYLASVDPLPPGESKVKKWLKAAKKFFAKGGAVKPQTAPASC